MREGTKQESTKVTLLRNAWNVIDSVTINDQFSFCFTILYSFFERNSRNLVNFFFFLFDNKIITSIREDTCSNETPVNNVLITVPRW